MDRRFQHLNHEWRVELSGTSHGVASGISPKLTSWGVWFSRVDDKSAKPFFGSVLKSDLSKLSDEDLRKSLESALVMKALEDPEWDWRTVAGVAEETGLPEGKVRELLESSTSVIRSSVPDNEGRSLYTTREHYKARRSFLDSLRTAT
jgi:hypothetical protein